MDIHRYACFTQGKHNQQYLIKDIFYDSVSMTFKTYIISLSLGFVLMAIKST